MQVPEGWIKETTGSLCISIVPGRNKPKSFTGEIPWVTTPDITARYIPTKEQELFVSKAEMQECGGKLVPVDSVIMAAVGDLGLVAINSEPVMLNQQLHAFVPKLKITTEFLAYWLSTQQQYMLARASKTTIPYLNKSNCESIPVLVPPLKEQQKIVQILSAWDKAITTTEQLLANSQQQKKALMQQLLTGAHPSKPRLLDDNGQRFSGEWEFKTISQMGKVLSGGTPDTNSAEYWDGSINWLTPTDVTALKSRFVEETARKISSEGVKNSSAKLLPAGSLMVCTRATIGALAISTSEICTNQGFKNIVPGKGFDVNFIYYLLLNNIKEFVRKASGSTFLEISKKDFENVKLLCPELQEQQKIATVLTTADNEITRLQQKLDQLKQEKKALMQQLLTGKRRVKVEEVA